MEGQVHQFGAPGSPSVIKIRPFQVAVLKTREILCIPRFLIARWNIRVKHVYEGLLWVGAPQVDPGFTGYLYCPIYNLSGRDVFIRQGEALALMDFVKTTAVEENSIKYHQKTERLILEDYVEELESGLFNEVKGRLDSFEDDLRANEKTVIAFASTVFGVLALGVTILFTASIDDKFSFLEVSPLATSIFFALAIFGAVSSIFAMLQRRSYVAKIGVRRRWYQSSLLILFCILGLSVFAGNEFYSYEARKRSEFGDQFNMVSKRMDEALKRIDVLQKEIRFLREKITK